MKLKNTGWAFAYSKGRSGLIPLSYLVINKKNTIFNTLSDTQIDSIPIPRKNINTMNKSHTKRVSFGETQVFENIDLNNDNKTSKTNKLYDAAKENSYISK